MGDETARIVLPIPDRAFGGVIKLDAKDPTRPFRRSNRCGRRRSAPNVLMVLIDDSGFAASSAFGGPCEHPDRPSTWPRTA